MKILVANPNTSTGVTDRLVAAGRLVASPGTELLPMTAAHGVPYIATRAEAAIGSSSVPGAGHKPAAAASRSVTSTVEVGRPGSSWHGTLLENRGGTVVPWDAPLGRAFSLQLLDPLRAPVDGGRDFSLVVARHDVLRAIGVPGFDREGVARSGLASYVGSTRRSISSRSPSTTLARPHSLTRCRVAKCRTKMRARTFSLRWPSVMYCRLPPKSAKASMCVPIGFRKPGLPPRCCR